MSYNKKTFTSKKNNKFCKVCYDANLSENEYTSHWVKDKPGKNGKIVCPYLLSLVCRFCKEKGHTPKHCPKILFKNEKTKIIKSKKLPQQSKPVSNLKSKKNRFNILTYISESESETDSDSETNTKSKSVSLVKNVELKKNIQINNNDFPCLLKMNKTIETEKKLNNWISILKKETSSKPKPIIQTQVNKIENIEEKNSVVERKDDIQKNTKNILDLSININPNMSWADIMDEESEDITAF